MADKPKEDLTPTKDAFDPASVAQMLDGMTPQARQVFEKMFKKQKENETSKAVELTKQVAAGTAKLTFVRKGGTVLFTAIPAEGPAVMFEVGAAQAKKMGQRLIAMADEAENPVKLMEERSGENPKIAF